MLKLAGLIILMLMPTLALVQAYGCLRCLLALIIRALILTLLRNVFRESAAILLAMILLALIPVAALISSERNRLALISSEQHAWQACVVVAAQQARAVRGGRPLRRATRSTNVRPVGQTAPVFVFVVKNAISVRCRRNKIAIGDRCRR